MRDKRRKVIGRSRRKRSKRLKKRRQETEERGGRVRRQRGQRLKPRMGHSSGASKTQGEKGKARNNFSHPIVILGEVLWSIRSFTRLRRLLTLYPAIVASHMAVMVDNNTERTGKVKS